MWVFDDGDAAVERDREVAMIKVVVADAVLEMMEVASITVEEGALAANYAWWIVEQQIRLALGWLTGYRCEAG